MSELKAETIVPQGTTITLQMYPKAETDKVIAEKDKEIQRLENLCESYRIDCDNLAIREANAYKEIERDNKQLRHQKYKRSLDKAKLCESEEKRLEAIAPIFDTDKECWEYNSDYWYKWRECWLKIAEQFKEAK